MSGAAPTFSVVTPMRNAAPHLPGLFDTLSAQTDRDFELVLVDDASQDASIEGARGEAARASFPVQLLKRAENGGPGAARNDGIASARGEIVAFLDADDLWDPALLATYRKILERERDVTILGVQGMVEDGEGRNIEPVIYDYVFDLGDPAAALLWSSYLQTSGVAVRRPELPARPFDESLRIAEDRDLWIRLALGGRLYLHPSPLFRYRRLPGSAMDRATAADYDLPLLMVQKNLRRFGSRIDAADARRALGKAWHDAGEALIQRPGHRREGARRLLAAIRYGYEPVRSAKKILAAGRGALLGGRNRNSGGAMP
ncbi:hypothetical protein B5C34_08740 [Pacificimonas flava]|uniref:Glycosyltransferase 2-like domain-containing protein n=2 Tax=Pacificimonas TaxID=1960290 RepID=A0A219B6X7_9SPHN|nr:MULTISPECIES: glycosyltransferase family 2 protein [Pacificimonas]MBZ6379248.1 glycosyltransferase family 2 protein [Pacificimonas aurantium]OWV33538.1 hypothetical protein B5C34_08740 [Pacificimonas flava]